VFLGRRVAAIIPAFNEERHIAGVLANMPDFVDHMIVIDDKSTDQTVKVVSELVDPRIVLICQPSNQGLGSALVSGYKQALALQADVVVVMAGDDQMDPGYLPALLEPICTGSADVTKGNRFSSRASLRTMPRNRIIGSLVLTWLTRLASGYSQLQDSQNGYVAISTRALRMVSLASLAHGYSVENAMLIELGRIRARLVDVPIPARYGTETSKMRLARDGPAILGTILLGVAKRVGRLDRRRRGKRPVRL
jgi:glycosyltransferase involved in cell wall biosynthesis